ncbi:Rap guanine nucleotide exchange factor (GEF) 1 [Chamberlinius hualienensis]
MSKTDKSELGGRAVSSSGGPSRSGGRLARRARSFKEDLLERFIQMRSPSSNRSSSPHKTLHHHSKFKHEPSGLGLGLAPPLLHSNNDKMAPEKASPETDVLSSLKDLENALRYFQDLIDKKMSILPQSATVVLEMVLAIHTALHNHLTDEQSSLLMSSYNQVYHSLANLVKWADVVLIHGEKDLDKANLADVVTMVRSAVKSLVDVVMEKLRNKELSNGFSPLTNGRLAAAAAAANNTDTNTNHVNKVDLFPHQSSTVLEPVVKVTRSGLSTLGHSISSDSILGSCQSSQLDTVPPPKPPLLTDFNRSHNVWSNCSSVPDIGPPALPPKKRFNPNSSCRWNHPASVNSLGTNNERLTLSAGSSRDSGEWLSSCSGVGVGVGGRRVTSGSDWNHSPSSLSPRSVSASSLDSTMNQSGDELMMNLTVPKQDFEFAHSQTSSTSSSTTAFRCQQVRSTTLSWTTTSSSSSSQYGTGTNSDSAVDSMHSRFNNLSFEEINSSGVFSSSSKSDLSSSLTAPLLPPPAIPPKKREFPAFGGRPRTNSQYDNVPDSILALFSDGQGQVVSGLGNGIETSTAATSVTASGGELKLSRRMTIADGLFNNTMQAQCHFDTEPPPPLPPKKKNVMAYMQIFGSYVDSRNVNFSLPSSAAAAYELTMHREMSMSRSITTSTFGFSSSDSFDKNIQSPSPSDYQQLISNNGFQDLNRLNDVLALTNTNINAITTPPALPPKKSKIIPAVGQYDYVNEINHLTPASNHGGFMDKISSESSTAYPRIASFDGSNNSGEILQGNEEPNGEIGSKILDEIDAKPYLIMKNEGDEGSLDIRGGSIDALIVHASSAPSAELAYLDAFMTTYRTFISPVDLVNKLLYRYNKFGLNIADVARQRVSRNTFSLLVHVVGDFGIGDMSEEILQILCDFGYQLLCNGELALARALRKKVLEKWVAKINSPLAIAPLSSKGVYTKQSCLVDFKSEQLAEQMTLLDAEMFQKIEIPEVLVWSRLQKEELSPNLTAFTEHFNKMSYWARSRILERDDAKDRERYVIKFIKIMKHLRKINNFNSYLAILSAIDSAPIRRLEWQKHITEGLKEYCELIDSSSSFRAYRQALSETEPPCIPYIGLILQDLTFVHIGNGDVLPDGSVNFVKRWQQFNILETMRRFRKCQYNFKPCDRIIAFFNHFDDHLSEEAMWQISEHIKPRPKKVEQQINQPN